MPVVKAYVDGSGWYVHARREESYRTYQVEPAGVAWLRQHNKLHHEQQISLDTVLHLLELGLLTTGGGETKKTPGKSPIKNDIVTTEGNKFVGLDPGSIGKVGSTRVKIVTPPPGRQPPVDPPVDPPVSPPVQPPQGRPKVREQSSDAAVGCGCLAVIFFFGIGGLVAAISQSDEPGAGLIVSLVVCVLMFLASLIGAFSSGVASVHDSRQPRSESRDDRVRLASAQSLVDKAEALRDRNQLDEMMPLLEAVVATAPEVLEYRNTLAWMLLVHPNPVYRNPARGLDLARTLAAESGEQEPLYLNTLALAHFRAGSPADAAETQRRAMEVAGTFPPPWQEQLWIYEAAASGGNEEDLGEVAEDNILP